MVAPLLFALGLGIAGLKTTLEQRQVRKNIESEEEIVNSNLDNLSTTLSRSQALTGIQFSTPFEEIEKTRRETIRKLNTGRKGYVTTAIISGLGYSVDYFTKDYFSKEAS